MKFSIFVFWGYFFYQNIIYIKYNMKYLLSEYESFFRNKSKIALYLWEYLDSLTTSKDALYININ